MTKSDIIKTVSEKCDVTQVKAETVVETVFESLKEALKNGERIEIRGFGSFDVRQYKSYRGRNPRTGEVIQVPKKQLPVFKVGKELKAKVGKI